MQLTLSPDIEREALEEIRSRKRDESTPPLLLECLKVAAKLFVHWSPKRFTLGLVEAFTKHVEARNDRIANHLRWFHPATAELRDKVATSGLPASEELRVALDGLIRQIDESVASLLSLVELLDAGTRCGRAVHRSIRLLLEVKANAVDMKRAGRLVDAPDEVTLRIEGATVRMIQHHGRVLVGSAPSPDPRLLQLAEQALAQRELELRSDHRRELERV